MRANSCIAPSPQSAFGEYVHTLVTSTLDSDAARNAIASGVFCATKAVVVEERPPPRRMRDAPPLPIVHSFFRGDAKSILLGGRHVVRGRDEPLEIGARHERAIDVKRTSTMSSRGESGTRLGVVQAATARKRVQRAFTWEIVAQRAS